MFFRILAINN